MLNVQLIVYTTVLLLILVLFELALIFDAIFNSMLIFLIVHFVFFFK